MTEPRDDVATKPARKRAPKNIAPDPRFHSGVLGAGAAKTALAKVIKDDPHKAALIFRAVTNAGLQGAKPLGHLAALIAWRGGWRDYPTPPKDLKRGELAIIEARAGAITTELAIERPGARIADPPPRPPEPEVVNCPECHGRGDYLGSACEVCRGAGIVGPSAGGDNLNE